MTIIYRPIKDEEKKAMANIITTFLVYEKKVRKECEENVIGEGFINASFKCFYVIIEIGSNGIESLLGGAGIKDCRDKGGMKVCEFARFYIKKEARNKGLGTAFLHFMLQTARELGYQYMLLESHTVHMRPAIKLYKSNGFHLTWRRPEGCYLPVTNTFLGKSLDPILPSSKSANKRSVSCPAALFARDRSGGHTETEFNEAELIKIARHPSFTEF